MACSGEGLADQIRSSLAVILWDRWEAPPPRNERTAETPLPLPPCHTASGLKALWPLFAQRLLPRTRFGGRAEGEHRERREILRRLINSSFATAARRAVPSDDRPFGPPVTATGVSLSCDGQSFTCTELCYSTQKLWKNLGKHHSRRPPLPYSCLFTSK